MRLSDVHLTPISESLLTDNAGLTLHILRRQFILSLQSITSSGFTSTKLPTNKEGVSESITPDSQIPRRTSMKLAALLLTLLVQLAQSVGDSSRLHWVCFHYHKTGSEFCQHIAIAVANACKLTAGFDELWTEEKIYNGARYYHDDHAKLLKGFDLVVTRPLALIGNWSEILGFPGHSYRVFFMLRDPLEIILSAYKYHSQSPPPEKWISLPHQVCPNDTTFPVLELGRYYGNTTLVGLWTQRIIAECEAMLPMFRANVTYEHVLHRTASLRRDRPKSNPAADAYLASLHRYEHNDTVHGSDVYPAVRVETFRSLTEIALMAVTKLYEMPGMSLSMQLEEFGLGNRTQFRSAATRMMGFLLRDVRANERCPLCRCLDVPKAVALAESASFVATPTSSPGKGKKGKAHGHRRLHTHVTSGLMPSATKRMYMERLLQDPVLVPMLKLLAHILNHPTAPSGPRMIDVGLPSDVRDRISACQ